MSISPGEKIIHGNSILTRLPSLPLFVGFCSCNCDYRSLRIDIVYMETVNRDGYRMLQNNHIKWDNKVAGASTIFDFRGKEGKEGWLDVAAKERLNYASNEYSSFFSL